MIADIVIISIIILLAVTGMKRGIAVTILNIAGIIVTAAAAYYLSGILSDFIYDTFLKQTVTENIQQSINQSGVEYAVQNVLDTLPEWASGIVASVAGLFGITAQSIGSSVNASASTSVVVNTIENGINSIVTGAFDIVLFVLLSIIIFIIVKLIIKRLKGVFKLPVIKDINKLLGGILGIIEGIILVIILVNTFYVFVIPSNPQFLTNGFVSGYVFEFFCFFD